MNRTTEGEERIEGQQNDEEAEGCQISDMNPEYKGNTCQSVVHVCMKVQKEPYYFLLFKECCEEGRRYTVSLTMVLQCLGREIGTVELLSYPIPCSNGTSSQSLL